ncbi:hypothetical protein N5D11_15985 [Acinetobacter johnsonii]|uniref:Ribbon-helix-helix protein, CopG family n=1 Tax=Acinetobacter johnsonii TaxID=40214 RepID=A0AA42IHF9_ACIJO|nr:hypothetical protein [Acinetobacter johnsonii]MDH0657590.1 hypothetical protein [Acinetobacter johnsonii]QQT57385.1 hypothetical protein I6I50_13700 [Acinetobacter johnsonii]
MKTKPFAVRLPIALATALERQAERESITVADVIRRILGQSIQSDKNQLIDQLTSLNVQVKLLINGQQQIIKKLSEFDVDMGNE